jgi:predicted XRE-type DNA-binding protein
MFPGQFHSDTGFLLEGILNNWKDIKGYEGLYMVSQCGQVKSLDRIVNGRWGAKRIIKGRVLKPFKDKYGYFQAILCKNSQVKSAKAHRLVGKTFISNPNNFLQINHINGVKTDNRVENLEWCTCAQNMAHASKNGLKAKGENNGSAKLTEKNVLEIRSMLLQGFTQAEIAEKFGVGQTRISDIKTGKSWNWLKQINRKEQYETQGNSMPILPNGTK